MTQPIAIRSFGGEQPALDGRILPQDKAQISRNMRLGYGRLEPLKANQAEGRTVAADTQTIHLYNRDANAGQGFWLQWDGDVDVINSPVIDDVYGRVFWAGDGAPKMSVASIITASPPYPANQYLLGIPQPTNGTTLVVAGGADPDALPVSVVYAVTYVSAYGEEGPPSLPSAVVARPDGHGVTLSNLPGVPTGNYNIATKRIYRSDGGEYLLVAEVAVATASYVDTIVDADLLSVMESESWDAPDAALIGLTQLPNGVVAGHFDNVLCFTPAYIPHAWPTSYRLTTESKIVGIAQSANGLIVATESFPYLCVGSDPQSMQLVPLDIPQGCLSKRSIVDMGSFVLFASPDGLVAAGGEDAKVITKSIFTKAQWQALNPASFRAYLYDGAYLCFHDSGAFSLDIDNGDLTQLSDSVDCAQYDAIKDRLYLCQEGVISEYDTGNALTAVFRSRKSLSNDQTAYAWGKVDADAYPVTLRVYGDGALRHSKTVMSNRAFRLGSSRRYRVAELEIETSNTVHSVQLAISVRELV